MATAQPKQDALDAGPEAAPYDREFQFSDADFRSLVALRRERAGVSLSDSKRSVIYSRLSRRLRVLGLTSFRAYREYLQSADGEQEIESFINSISTNLTKFFRESHHFDHFRDRVALPFSQVSSSKPGQRLRIWSAGCSTGEEPYTIAAVIRRAVPDVERQDVKILATDIDTEVLSKGANGEYPAASVDDIPENYRSLFQPKGSRGTALVISDELKSLISFRHLNLMVHPWPMRGLFDTIFS